LFFLNRKQNTLNAAQRHSTIITFDNFQIKKTMFFQDKKINHLATAFVLACLLGATLAQAQTGPTDKVDVIKNFDAKLLDANKIKVPPTLPALDTTTKYQDYVVPARPLAVKYDAPKLKPLGMKAAPKEDQFKGYVKAGGGIPSSLYGEAGYGFAVKNKFDAQVWARHHRANFKDRENQKFDNTDVSVSGSGMLGKTTALEAKVAYSLDNLFFYGYDDDSLSFDSERVRQKFSLTDVGLRVFNGERNDNDLNYYVAPQVYSLSDNYANSETGFNLNIGGNKWFADKHVLRLNIRTDFSTYDDTVKQRLNNIYFQPSFTFHAGFLRLKIGGNFASNRDIFHVYPDAELSLRVFGDGIQLFAGANGDLRKNTYRTLSEYNPWIWMRGSEVRNSDWRNYFGGIRGNLGWADYSVQGGYSTVKNLALHQTLYLGDGITRFQVLYDSASVVNFQGTLRITPVKNLNVTGTLSHNVYEMGDQLAPWGLPRLEGNFGATYGLLNNKANVRANFYLADQIRRRDAEGTPGRDGALYDLGIGGSYYFTKNIGAFLDINNILNNTRERWHDYPMYGLNVLVGLSARF
jgi:hypothetical protein